MCSPLGLMGRELCCKEENGLWFLVLPVGKDNLVGRWVVWEQEETKVKAGACVPLSVWLPKG